MADDPVAIDLSYLTLLGARQKLDRGEVSSADLTRASLDRIARTDADLGAFLLVTAEQALEQARLADKRLAHGTGGPLTGIPFALKDIISVRGIRTTCGSHILENYVPVYQGQVAQRLLDQGAVLLGKTNMDEFAMGSSTEHSAFRPCRNPWNRSRVPGGSSGGSAAAVAAGLAYFALGTDTGGSIRQPAALTGVVGVKPSYGRVSRHGLVAFASSLDQIGPFARTVRDAALVLGLIAGHDPLDSTTLRHPVPDYVSQLEGGVKGLTIGLPREYFPDSMEPGVAARVAEALAVLEREGARIKQISLPTTEAALSSYYIVAPSEAMSNLARYDGVRFGLREASGDIWELFDRTREAGFGSEVKRRILLGAYALSKGYYDAYYVKAQQVRALVKAEFDRAFDEVDVIVGPTSPTVAFELGAKLGDPVAMYLADVFTLPANMAGICGISVPCGMSDGLPVGLQVLGPRLGEPVMFRVAHAYESAAGFSDLHPALGEAA
ncbi:MAG TPA: Asp-tRNA(Asn)/Glu-tRNA(Gln) amidotransferase subunit GatA [Chloroflexota bacterium]|nr:Asp-tRNA(Asn)/Glu-tRNA(Gln) amidotransferase subunit GatA [Chloroflexota bacterium]